MWCKVPKKIKFKKLAKLCHTRKKLKIPRNSCCLFLLKFTRINNKCFDNRIWSYLINMIACRCHRFCHTHKPSRHYLLNMLISEIMIRYRLISDTDWITREMNFFTFRYRMELITNALITMWNRNAGGFFFVFLLLFNTKCMYERR